MGHQQLCNLNKVPWRWHCHLQRFSKGKIVGIGNIKIGLSSLIEDVVLVGALKHNLLSISQGLRVIFDDSTCDVLDKKSNSCVLFGFRENNVYWLTCWIYNAMPLIWMSLIKTLGYGIGD